MEISFSIITVTFNAKKELLKTIDSVQSQIFGNYKHIIKDGLSNDKTNEIDFSKFKKTIFIESKDNGVYEAMNQATEYIENEFVIFLNAGDYFFSESTLQELSLAIKKKPSYLIYSGGTIQVDLKNKKLKRLIGCSNLYKFFPFSQLPHPSFIIRKSTLLKLDKPFDEYLKIAGDYKQQLVLRKKKLWKVFYLQQIISIMPLGGISNKNKLSIFEGYKETLNLSFELFNILSLYIIFLKVFLYFHSKINVLKIKNFGLDFRKNHNINPYKSYKN